MVIDAVRYYFLDADGTVKAMSLERPPTDQFIVEDRVYRRWGRSRWFICDEVMTRISHAVDADIASVQAC